MTATVPAQAGTSIGVLKVLTRADSRWASRNHDDAAPAQYLRHLADAVRPHLQQDGALVDTDQAAELEQLRVQLAEARSGAQRRVDRAVEASKATVDELSGRIDELRIDLAAAKRDRAAALKALETAGHQHGEQIAAAVADARAEAALQRDADQRVLHDAQADRDRYRQLLGQLLDAVLGDRDPHTALDEQTEAAVDLVQRVIAAYTTPAEHQHQYTYRGPGRTPGPCTVDGCAKPYPARRTR